MTGQVLCSGDQSAAFTNAVKQFWPQTCLTSSSRACWDMLYRTWRISDTAWMVPSLISWASESKASECRHQLIADDCDLLAHKDSNLQINKSRRRRKLSGWLSASVRSRYCTSLLQTPQPWSQTLHRRHAAGKCRQFQVPGQHHLKRRRSRPKSAKASQSLAGGAPRKGAQSP